MFTWARLRAAELSGQLKAEKEIDHIVGVTCVDPKEDLKIGDHTVPDCFESYNTTATAPDRVKFYTNWRVDPLLTFTLGLVRVNNGDRLYLKAYKSGANQYEVKEASDLFRVLVYAGVYGANVACERVSVASLEVLLNRIISYGALLMGVMEWWHLSSGMSIFDRNMIGSFSHQIDPEIFSIISAMTQGFSMRPPENAPCIWHGGNTDIYDLPSITKTALAVNDADWIECWYGGVVPWWFVKGIIEKFGFTTAVKCPAKQEYDVGLSDYDNMTGYFVRTDNSGSLDLAALTSSVRYDVKAKNTYYPWFTVYTPNKNARVNDRPAQQQSINRICIDC